MSIDSPIAEHLFWQQRVEKELSSTFYNNLSRYGNFSSLTKRSRKINANPQYYETFSTSSKDLREAEPKQKKYPFCSTCSLHKKEDNEVYSRPNSKQTPSSVRSIKGNRLVMSQSSSVLKDNPFTIKKKIIKQLNGLTEEQLKTFQAQISDITTGKSHHSSVTSSRGIALLQEELAEARKNREKLQKEMEEIKHLLSKFI